MKDFIIIGNKNAPGMTGVFHYFMDKVMSVGNTIPFFEGLQGLTRWFTTLPVKSRKKLTLTANYLPEKYPKYDNYDAINVDKIKDIPCDYYGPIGVPITIFDYDLDRITVNGIMAGEFTTICEKGVLEHLPKINGEKKYTRVIIKCLLERKYRQVNGGGWYTHASSFNQSGDLY